MAKPAMPIDDKLYNLKLKCGADNNGFLSVKKDFTGVELVAKVDASGLQQWRFLEYMQGPTNSYSLECYVNGQSYFINNAPTEKAGLVGSYPGVNTHIWQILPQTGRYFHFISAFSGVPSERFLGISPSDDSLSLQQQDDGSGRQQWQLYSTEPISDKMDPYFENELLNLIDSCPNMVAVLLGSQCKSESRVKDNIFYCNFQPGGQNENAFAELLRAYKYQIDDQSNWSFDLFWSINIAIARRNSSSHWHSYASKLPKGKQTLTRCLANSWLGTAPTGWSDAFTFTVYVI